MTFKIHVYTAQFLFYIRLDFEEVLKDQDLYTNLYLCVAEFVKWKHTAIDW